MQAAWPGTIVEEANLTVQIAALRRTLGAWSDEQEWIVTVPRIGYRLAWPPPAEAIAESGPPAIAVLPFANLSSDPEQSFLADGVVEEIITALSRFRTFAVVARNSTFVFKGRAVDVRQVARDLGVRYVLEGSVRRSGDRVRVAAQLIEGASGAHLWAEKFEGAIVDIFDFQDEITRSVIGLVEPQIRKAEIDRTRRKRPESLDAWDLYLQALPLVYGARVQGYTEAIELLDRALVLDPTYGPALALASWAHEKRKTYRRRSHRPAWTTSRQALDARPARRLKPILTTPWRWPCSAGSGFSFAGTMADLRLCARAVELNPNNRAVLDLGAVAQLYAGDLDQAIAYGMRALQLSPGAPDAYMCTRLTSRRHISPQGGLRKPLSGPGGPSNSKKASCSAISFWR